MDTVTGGITVGPGEMTLGGDSWSPGSWVEGELEHDLRDPNRMCPRALANTVASTGGVGHVGSIVLV